MTLFLTESIRVFSGLPPLALWLLSIGAPLYTAQDIFWEHEHNIPCRHSHTGHTPLNLQYTNMGHVITDDLLSLLSLGVVNVDAGVSEVQMKSAGFIYVNLINTTEYCRLWRIWNPCWSQDSCSFFGHHLWNLMFLHSAGWAAVNRKINTACYTSMTSCQAGPSWY